LYIIQGLVGPLGRLINPGYFPLNKGIITERYRKPGRLAANFPSTMEIYPITGHLRIWFKIYPWPKRNDSPSTRALCE
jgi:hypothetical protein